jgi:hypothetical protein
MFSQGMTTGQLDNLNQKAPLTIWQAGLYNRYVVFRKSGEERLMRL